MTKEIIEKYIQFAIDNGYNELPTMEDGWYFINDNTLTITSEGEGIVEFEGNIIEIIVSKEFIEAVTIGLNPTFEISSSGFYSEYRGIIEKQAYAIAEGKLEEFINNLLPNK